jgi:nitrite reductase (NADH) small subunit
MDWIEICGVDDIPMLGARIVRRPVGQDIAIFRNAEQQVFALLDACPHQKGLLSQGVVQGTTVTCPNHQWQIGLSDGCAREPAKGCTARFTVQVVDGRVRLKTEEIKNLGIE